MRLRPYFSMRTRKKKKDKVDAKELIKRTDLFELIKDEKPNNGDGKLYK